MVALYLSDVSGVVYYIFILINVKGGGGGGVIIPMSHTAILKFYIASVTINGNVCSLDIGCSAVCLEVPLNAPLGLCSSLGWLKVNIRQQLVTKIANTCIAHLSSHYLICPSQATPLHPTHTYQIAFSIQESRLFKTTLLQQWIPVTSGIIHIRYIY